MVGVLTALLFAAGPAAPQQAPPLGPEWRHSAWFGERTRLEKTPDGIRILLNLPPQLDPALPTRLVVFATPNGNTLEETFGAEVGAGVPWRFDIQHVGAQVRRLRELRRTENLALGVIQPEGKSWPAWRREHPDNAHLRALVEQLKGRIPGGVKRLSLTAHSGGGSFLHGFIEADGAIPAEVDRFGFLDANYSFDAEQHAPKLVAWLRGEPTRYLLVLAYDDRTITVDGKPVVGPTGGTFRATGRMIDALGPHFPLTITRPGDRERFTGLDGRVVLDRDLNPQNKILHTVLVEQNGLLEVLSHGTPEAGRTGAYRGERSYSRWVQPFEPASAVGEEPLGTIPPRPADSPSGTALFERIAALPGPERERILERELVVGNVPGTLRRLRVVETRMVTPDGVRHTARFAVMPDYVAVGGDADWVRTPLTPMTTHRIADRWQCALITRRLSDAIHAAATLRLKPQPLVEAREATATFLQHHRLIEERRAGKAIGHLLSGIKKDVVLSNRLREQPGRVAIYGWHFPDGHPIQPLTTVHRESYVDYSHGVRLVSRRVLVDGQPMDYLALLKHPTLWPLASDEGPMEATLL